MAQKSHIELKTLQPNPNISGVEDVTPQEVHQLVHKLRIIDVRRPDEWVGELGHIAQAELMTLDTFPARISELDPNETIVFICRSGARSAQAAGFAQQNGFTAVYNMLGGMIAWVQANYEVEDRNA